MDAVTRLIFKELGWREQLGVDADGRPYVAMIRGTEYFHVYEASALKFEIKPESYGDGARSARTVSVTWCCDMPAVALRQGGRTLGRAEEIVKAPAARHRVMGPYGHGEPPSCMLCDGEYPGAPCTPSCPHRMAVEWVAGSIPGPIAWHPISTGPKDGSVLILAAQQGVVMAYWSLGDERWAYPHAEALADGPQRPTHWMRLPAPPAEAVSTP